MRRINNSNLLIKLYFYPHIKNKCQINDILIGMQTRNSKIKPFISRLPKSSRDDNITDVDGDCANLLWQLWGAI